MNVRWLVTASNDLERIADYLHANRPAVAQETLCRIFNGVNSLGESPYKGRAAGTEGKRRLTFSIDPYVATYRIVRDSIHVLGIRHTSRKPLKH